MQVSAADFSKMQLAILYEFIQEHTDIRQTLANGKALGGYLAENGLPVSWKNLTTAYTNLKAAGKLELAKTAQEIEKEQIEAARAEILRQVAAKIAPAKIDFSNSVVMHKIATYLHAKENSLMSVDRVLRAIENLKFDENFWVVPPADLYQSPEYVHGGLRNHAKNPQPEAQETETRENFGRRNHADDDAFDKKLKEGFKKVRKGMETEEGRRIGLVVEHAISGYRAQGPNRIDYVKTEIIQGLLRKYAAKHGADVVRIVRELPDDPSSAEMYLRRRL